MTEAAEEKPKKKKIQPGSIQLMMAGDLILGRNPDRSLSQLFRKYEALLEAFANMDRDERLINYKYLMALIITSHAKKTQDITERKALFDDKNRIFVDLITDRNSRRKMQFKYLISNNFRVIEFCEECIKSNTEQDLPKHKWKFCRVCKVDRKFFNVLSMQHKFPEGMSTIFLSNDMMHKLPPLRNLQKTKLTTQKEETVFGRYHYNVKNLDVFSLESAQAIIKKLIPDEPPEPTETDIDAGGGAPPRRPSRGSNSYGSGGGRGSNSYGSGGNRGGYSNNRGSGYKGGGDRKPYRGSNSQGSGSQGSGDRRPRPNSSSSDSHKPASSSANSRPAPATSSSANSAATTTTSTTTTTTKGQEGKSDTKQESKATSDTDQRSS